MKYLGIDYGEKKIGLAVTDGLGLMAFPKCVLQYSKTANVLKEITIFAKKEEITGVVVGMPLYKDGAMSAVGAKVEVFIQELLPLLSVPCYILNEYLTSSEARSQLRALGKKTQLVDAHVAALLLEEFLLLAPQKRVEYKAI